MKLFFKSKNKNVEKFKIFVYGTLKEGCALHNYLRDSKLISKTHFVRGTLYALSRGFPAVVLEKNGKVFGEVYEVNLDVLQSLDYMELSEGYERKLVKLDDGTEAWIYHIEFDKIKLIADKSCVIEDGIWRNFGGDFYAQML